MSIGTSIFLIAAGAVLHWAVTGHIAHVRVHTLGTILMVVGVGGLAVSLFFGTLWTRRGGPLTRF